MQDTLELNQGHEPLLIAGPCLIETLEKAIHIAEEVKRISIKYGLKPIFKGSYKKANRTSVNSFSTIGETNALSILREVHQKTGMDVITDVHETIDIPIISKYVTHLQIPAFLCRQTELIVACARSGKPTLIKKGQFLSPEACRFVADKFKSVSGHNPMLCERGASFGYNDLIVDATCIPRMKEASNCAVIMDCTHSLQKPNRSNGTSGGNPELVGTLAKFAFATGADGLFIEVHPQPQESPSDSESILQLDKLESVIAESMKIWNVLNASL